MEKLSVCSCFLVEVWFLAFQALVRKNKPYNLFSWLSYKILQRVKWKGLLSPGATAPLLARRGCRHTAQWAPPHRAGRGRRAAGPRGQTASAPTGGTWALRGGEAGGWVLWLRVALRRERVRGWCRPAGAGLRVQLRASPGSIQPL